MEKEVERENKRDRQRYYIVDQVSTLERSGKCHYGKKPSVF